MDISVITQLIGSLGFPIVCCGYMMIKMNKTLEENTKQTEKVGQLIDLLMKRYSYDHPNPLFEEKVEEV